MVLSLAGMSDEVILRKLTVGDVPAAMRLSTEAGWNQTEVDWRTLIRLSPEGCFAIEANDDVVSTATLFCYGRRLAWVGMVLTGTAYRGRGFARRLLAELLAVADKLGIESVKLDATNEGQPLYEKLGFRSEQVVERWERQGGAMNSKQPRPDLERSENWVTVDLRAFGADRSTLLRRLSQLDPPMMVDDSYVLTRPGRRTRYLGPCVASSTESARMLVERAVREYRTSDLSWDILVENKSAVSIARAMGFTPKRHLLRMVRGKELRGNESAIYGIAGFELG